MRRKQSALKGLAAWCKLEMQGQSARRLKSDSFRSNTLPASFTWLKTPWRLFHSEFSWAIQCLLNLIPSQRYEVGDYVSLARRIAPKQSANAILLASGTLCSVPEAFRQNYIPAKIEWINHDEVTFDGDTYVFSGDIRKCIISAPILF